MIMASGVSGSTVRPFLARPVIWASARNATAKDYPEQNLQISRIYHTATMRLEWYDPTINQLFDQGADKERGCWFEAPHNDSTKARPGQTEEDVSPGPQEIPTAFVWRAMFIFRLRCPSELPVLASGCLVH
ncbi:hypothetical protein RRG08_041144 [Elysia crispata]|uniref:Uncharacterized protein n=1 Tax=Elysia crispata TaxID=231223 RepID=A0AAE0XXM3_9GAST|nr:hypothetical protein RRG08_041144 [Elysia crispata]